MKTGIFVGIDLTLPRRFLMILCPPEVSIQNYIFSRTRKNFEILDRDPFFTSVKGILFQLPSCNGFPLVLRCIPTTHTKLTDVPSPLREIENVSYTTPIDQLRPIMHVYSETVRSVLIGIEIARMAGLSSSMEVV